MGGKRKKTEVNQGESKTKKLNQHWAFGLLEAMEDPEFQVKTDDLVTVIKDKYPKAEFHYLVIPKENINDLKSLKPEHTSLLKHMHKVAKKLAKEPQHANKNFLIGYHAEASMVRLHLHMLSDDLNSICVKTKKHWNSFTTDFFLDSKSICTELMEKGTVQLPSKDMCKKFLDTPLKCHKCDYVPKHMPDLKIHILSHITS